MANNAFFDIYPELDPLAFDIGSTPDAANILNNKLDSVKQAAADKIAAFADWNTKSYPEQVGQALWSGLENITGLATKATANIAQSFGQGALEPDSILMQNQASSAENNLRNLARQIDQSVKNTGIVSPELLKQHDIEQERFNQAKSWLNTPINTSQTSGVLGRFAPELFGSGYTRADALAGNQRVTEAVSPLTMFGDTLKESAAARVPDGAYATIDPVMDKYSADAKKAWDEGNAVTGTLGFVGNTLLGIIDAVATDPKAATLKASESLAQSMSAAVPGLNAVVFGSQYTEDRQDAYKSFQKEHGGKLPNASEAAIIDTVIAASVASDFAGDVFMTKALPGLKQIFKTKGDVIPDTVKAAVASKYPALGATIKEVSKVAAIPLEEAVQGGFQNFSEQTAAKQDVSKIDTKELSKAAIEEGVATTVMGSGAALAVPSNISEAKTKNDGLKQTIAASDSFKQTEAYKPFKEVKEAPVAAFRAFEAVVKDTASTPEQKQVAFDTAVGALVNTPQFNTQKIASSLVAQAKAAGLTVEEPISNVLDQLAKPTLGVIGKVGDVITKSIDVGVRKVGRMKDSYIENYDISDEQISKDPVRAARILSQKPFVTSTLEEYKTDANNTLMLLAKLQKVIDSSEQSDVAKAAFTTSVTEITERMNNASLRLKNAATNEEIVAETTAPNAHTKKSFGSSQDALIPRLPDLTTEQLTKLEQVSTLRPEVMALVKEFKAAKSMAGVSDNIKENSDGKQISLKEHTALLNLAINADNKAAATDALAKLTKFAKNYASKNQRVQDAWAEVTAENTTVKSKSVAEIEKDKFLDINYGVEGKASSKNLVKNIFRDNALVQAHLKLAQHEFNKTFNKEKVNATQTTETVTTEAQQPQIPTTTATTVPVTPIQPADVITPTSSKEVALRNEIENLTTKYPDSINFLNDVLKLLNENKLDKVVQQLEGFKRNKGISFTPTPPAPIKIKAILKEGLLDFIDSMKFYIAKEFQDGTYENLQKQISIKKNSLFTKIDNILTEVPKETHKDLSDLIKSIETSLNLEKEQKLRPSQDPLIVFRDKTGKMNPAVSQATAIAGYWYMASRANSLAFNNLDTIGLMLRDPDNAYKYPEAVALFTHIGVNTNNLAEDLADVSYELLGISIQDEVLKKRVKLALGFIAIKGLTTSGYVDINEMDLAEYNSLLKKGAPISSEQSAKQLAEREGKTISFTSVKFQRNAKGEILRNEDSQSLKADIVNKTMELFKNKDIKDKFTELINQPYYINPRTTLTDKIPTYVVGTFQKYSATAKKAIQKINNLPYSFNIEAMELLIKAYENSETKTALLTSFGWVTPEKLAKTSIYEREILQSQNEDIERELSHLLEYYSVLKNKTDVVYFNHEIWKSNRIGITNDTGINPLQNKITRHLVSLVAFETKLTKDILEDTPESKEKLSDIRAAIAAGFDIESGKLKREDVLNKLTELEKKPEIVAALKDMSPKNIMAVMNMPKMLKTHTLEALLALKALHDLQTTGKESTVRLSHEVDGKTNGVAIALAQTFGIKNTTELIEALNAVGLFTKEEDQQYLQVNGAGSKDLYLQIVDTWQSIFNEIVLKAKDSTYLQKLYKTQQAFIGNITRDMAKYPFMTTVFGKALPNISADFGYVLLGKVYSKITEIAGQVGEPDFDLKQKLDDLNNDIYVLAGSQKNNVGTFTVDNYLDHRLNPRIEEAIRIGSAGSYGLALTSSIDSKFKEFFNNRIVMNKAMTAVSNLFISLVANKMNGKILTKEALQMLMETPVNKGGLREFVPSFQNVHGQNVNEWSLALKIIPTRATDKSTIVQVTFNNKNSPVTPNGVQRKNRSKEEMEAIQAKIGKPTYSISGNIKEIQLIEPGVGSTIIGIHSLDAAEMYEMIDTMSIFGAHDAVYSNALEIQKAGQNFNTIFSDINQRYSIIESMADRVAQVEKDISILSKDNPEFADIFNSFGAEVGLLRSGEKTPEGKVIALPFDEVRADIAAKKEKFWKQITWISQYVTHNSGIPNKNYESDDLDAPPSVGGLLADLPPVKPPSPPTDTAFDPLKMADRAEDFTYTSDQVNVITGLVNTMQNLPSGTNTWTLVNGRAGTGKTTIVENLINSAKHFHLEPFVLAPTNKALQVLVSKLEGVTGYTAKTLHSTVYDGATVNKKGEMEFAFDIETAKFKADNKYVIIIDESSMVSQKMLQDLITRLEGITAQIVVVGDENQVEPVINKNSEDFKLKKDSNYQIDKDPLIFTERSFIPFKKENIYKLTKVRRVGLESYILKYATVMADKKKSIALPIGEYGKNKELTIDTEENVTAMAIEKIAENVNNAFNTVMLFSKNEDRLNFIANVRNKLFGKDEVKANPLFVDREPLIAVATTKLYANSEPFNLIGAEATKVHTFSYLSNPYRKKETEPAVNLEGHLYKVIKDNKTHYMIVLPKLKEPSISREQLLNNLIEDEATTKAFNDIGTTRIFGKNGIPKRIVDVRFLQGDLSVATYAYGMTVHKSQGSQWDNVYTALDGRSYRLLYTAVTRAAKTVSVSKINAESYSEDRLITESNKSIEGTPTDTAQSTDTTEAPQENERNYEYDGLPPEIPDYMNEMDEYLKQMPIEDIPDTEKNLNCRAGE